MATHGKLHSLANTEDHSDGLEWNSLKTTVTANSASWSAAPSEAFVQTNFVNVSGDTMTGDLTISTLASANEVVVTDSNGKLIQHANLTWDGTELLVDGNVSSTGTISAGGGTPGVGELQNVLWVAKNGSDSNTGGIGDPYLTVKAAMDSITDASEPNPYHIRIQTGDYNEDNPIECKSYVSLVGESQLTRLSAINTDQPILSASPFAEIRGLTLQGAISAGGSGILYDQPGPVVFQDISLISNYDGIVVDNANSDADINTLKFISLGGDSGQHGIYCKTGTVKINGVETLNNPTLDTLIFSEGSNSVVYGFDCNAVAEDNITTTLHASGGARINWSGLKTGGVSPVNKMPIGVHSEGATLTLNDTNLTFCNSGALVTDAGVCHMVGLQTFQCDEALYVGNEGQLNDLQVYGGRIVQSTNYDLFTDNSNNTISFAGVIMDETKIETGAAEVVGAHISTTDGDEGFAIKGELHVGTPELPKESVFGEGDSYTRKTLVWIYDADTTTFTDVSLSAQSATSSTFLMPSAVGSALYMASDIQRGSDNTYVKHGGFKTQLNNSLTYNNSAHVIEEEYWNGSSWVEFPTMSVNGVTPYDTYGNDIFSVSGTQQIRFDPLIETLWVANSAVPTGDAIDRYWSRIDVISGLNVKPEIEQVKLHSNRFEINADGWIEYFGQARPLSILPLRVESFYSAGGSTPGNQAMSPSTNISVSFEKNGATDGDEIAVVTQIPYELDTSYPLRLQWAFIPDGNVVNDDQVGWNIRYVWTQNEDSVNVGSGFLATPSREEKLETLTNNVSDFTSQSGPNAIGGVFWNSVDLDISELRARRGSPIYPDILWILIQREDPAATSWAGDTNFTAINAQYAKWCEGGHF